MTAVYIVASRSRTLYIGVTRNLSYRVLRHKRGTASEFTTRYKCDRLVYYEEFTMVENAIAREKQLKGWSRRKKLWLIAQKNPGWLDLAEVWYDPRIVPHRNAGPSTRVSRAEDCAREPSLARDDAEYR